MKRLIGMCVIALLFSSPLSWAQDINFRYHNMTEALEESKTTGKPIFVDVYTTWCGPCRAMSNNVFTNNELAKIYNENFINVKIDAEKAKNFGYKHNVSGYPTLIYFSPNGKETHRTVGYSEAWELKAIAKKILEKQL